MTSGVNIYTGVGGEIPSKKKKERKEKHFGEKRKKSWTCPLNTAGFELCSIAHLFLESST